MEQIKTKTGKYFTIRFCGSTVIGITSVLYIEFIGYSMLEIVSVFSSKEETEHLQAILDGSVKREYRGYTQLIESIVLADSGNLRIALTVPIEDAMQYETEG